MSEDYTVEGNSSLSFSPFSNKRYLFCFSTFLKFVLVSVLRKYIISLSKYKSVIKKQKIKSSFGRKYVLKREAATSLSEDYTVEGNSSLSFSPFSNKRYLFCFSTFLKFVLVSVLRKYIISLSKYKSVIKKQKIKSSFGRKYVLKKRAATSLSEDYTVEGNSSQSFSPFSNKRYLFYFSTFLL